MLRNDRTALQQQVAEMADATARYELTAMLDRALEDRKITVSLRNRLAADYAGNTPALKELLAAMPAYRPITEALKTPQDNAEANWTWDDYEKNDPAGKKLKALRASDPTRYKLLFDNKFTA